VKLKRFEESNVDVLDNYGFTREKGFIVPRHKVVGIKSKDGEIYVDRNGKGLTISEDVSEDGKYNIGDIEPLHFGTLSNRLDFAESYRIHMDGLLELCSDSSVTPKIHDHSDPEIPDDPKRPISKMPLLRQRDNIGKIVIGDLDHLEFRLR